MNLMRLLHLQLIFTLCVITLTIGNKTAIADTITQDRIQDGQPDLDEQRAGMFATEVWLTPLILLPGVALLIVSTSARFGQLHTELHRLVDRPDDHAKIVARHLLGRSAFFRDALVALYVSVGLFSLGSLLGGVVNFWRPNSLWVVGGATMIGIGCIVYAAIQLVREAMICLQVFVDHTQQIQKVVEVKDT